MKNFVNILRWIFCVPLAIIGGMLAKVFIMSLSLLFLLPPLAPFKALAFVIISMVSDIGFIFGFAYSFAFILPSHKKIATFSVMSLLTVVFLIVSIYSYFFSEEISSAKKSWIFITLLAIYTCLYLGSFSYLLIKIWKAKEPFHSLLDIFKK